MAARRDILTRMTPSADSHRGPQPLLVLLAVLAALLPALAGCPREEVRLLDPVPGPFFGPPQDRHDEPPRPQTDYGSLGDAVRNHVQPSRRWDWIVLHHSSTPGGNAAAFDKFHREVRGWDELGYDFVIGNGSDSADGLIEIGPRWIKQKWGAHCATPSHKYNDHGIGICLVGDFDKTRPTSAQLRSCVLLVRFLCREYNIPASHILGHRDGQASEGLPPEKRTDCPGSNFDVSEIRRLVAAGG
ncbi:MAG: hypothetical protein BIFFINMI_01928 [Phycisphaerae bacterium]|nr:hypothetical protein [Phycisphaerae bacterium]